MSMSFASALSAFSARMLFVTPLLLLAACDDISLPKVFGNEVPPEVLNEPRLVPSPHASVKAAQWPLLGAVPSKPKDFTPQPTIDAAKREMENDRNRAESLQQDYQAAPPVQPSLSQP